MPWLLALLWALMQVSVHYAHGVQIVFDSHRYMVEASKWLGESESEGLRLSYMSYAALLAFCIAIFGDVKVIVLLQLLLGGLSTIAFYRLSMHLLQHNVLAFIATALLLLWPLYQHWHFYIHTESIFASLAIIAFQRATTASTIGHFLQLLLLLAFIIFLRANGFMVAMAVGVYLAAAGWLKQGQTVKSFLVLVLPAGVLATVALGHFFLSDMSGIHSFTGHLLSGNVIQGYGKLKFVPDEVPVLEGSPVVQVGQLLWQEPIFFLKKSVARLVYYWLQIRPYFSLKHKIAIVLYLYPLYVLAVAGVWRRQLPVPFILAAATLGALFSAMVVVSSVDWDNRFLMPVLPFVFICAAAGIKSIGVWGKTEWQPLQT